VTVVNTAGASELVDQRGGVLLRVRLEGDETALGFVPAEVAKKVTALSSLTPVPGAGPSVLGLALAEGTVVTVLDVSALARAPAEGHASGSEEHPERPRGAHDWIVPGADRALLCQLGSFDVALTGGLVVATGLFDAAADHGVVWHGEVVPLVDVRALYLHAEAATFALRGGLPRGAQGLMLGEGAEGVATEGGEGIGG
jgi:hypothetical protein